VIPGLSPEQLEQITLAYRRAGKVRRAIAVARFNGWTLAMAAVLTGVSGVLDRSFWCVGFGAALGVMAWVEFTGAAGLRRFDLRAPRRLALNQSALGLLLVVYAVWQLVVTLHGGNTLSPELADNPDLAPLLGSSYQDLARSLSLTLYAGLLVLAVVCQGGMALYYYTRIGPVRTCAEQTPDWVRRLQESGAVNL
jgi:hypothetical protein